MILRLILLMTSLIWSSSDLFRDCPVIQQLRLCKICCGTGQFTGDSKMGGPPAAYNAIALT